MLPCTSLTVYTSKKNTIPYPRRRLFKKLFRILSIRLARILSLLSINRTQICLLSKFTITPQLLAIFLAAKFVTRIPFGASLALYHQVHIMRPMI